MTKNKVKPTSYILIFYNERDDELGQETYPMYKYNIKDIFNILEGKESTCDIWLGRYYKKRRKYVATELAYIWENGTWVNKLSA